MNPHYTVGNKTFLNPFAGIWESAQSGNFCELTIPGVEVFAQVDVPAIEQCSSLDLFRRKLEFLRDTHNKIRFHYTGGSDSHTLMLVAQDLGIEFDCVFTHTNSLEPNEWVEYEYQPAIEYAKNTGMQCVVHRPCLQDYEQFWYDKWSFEKYPGLYHGIVPFCSTLFLQDQPDGYLELIGGDKPRYFRTKENIYWILFDFDDYANAQPTEGFFDGLVCPELRVKQVIDGAKWILAHSEETGYLDYKTFLKQDFLNYLNLNPGIAIKISKTNQNHKDVGHFNEKHRRAMLQLIEFGRDDIVHEWLHWGEHIQDLLGDVPHGIESRNVYLRDINRHATLTTTVVRTGAIFQIHSDKLELLPHTDINRLT